MEIITHEYIKGWMDRESQVNQSGRAIVATSASEQPLRAIFASLRRSGIECSLKFCETYWELRIGRRDALQRFQKDIGFLCEDKSDKLNQILNSYKEQE